MIIYYLVCVDSDVSLNCIDAAGKAVRPYRREVIELTDHRDMYSHTGVFLSIVLNPRE